MTWGVSSLELSRIHSSQSGSSWASTLSTASRMKRAWLYEGISSEKSIGLPEESADRPAAVGIEGDLIEAPAVQQQHQQLVQPVGQLAEDVRRPFAPKALQGVRKELLHLRMPVEKFACPVHVPVVDEHQHVAGDPLGAEGLQP